MILSGKEVEIGSAEANGSSMRHALSFRSIGAKKKVVVVRVFIKKTQKTPNREIQLAMKRAKEISQ